MSYRVKEIIIKVLAVVIGIAICVVIGIFAYKHRVVEVKQYSVVGTITDKEYHKAYTTTSYDPSTKTVRNQRHPERCYIYYSVTFDGGTYDGNRVNVHRGYYDSHSVGDHIDCIFERQWHADGTETYDIQVVK